MSNSFFPLSKKEAEKEGFTYSSSSNRKALFPTQLRELRKDANLSQEQFAKIIGVTKSTIGLYETGDNVPDVKTLSKIATHFNVSADYLIGLSECTNYENHDINKAIGLNEAAINNLKKVSHFEADVINAFIGSSNFEKIIDSISLFVTSDSDSLVGILDRDLPYGKDFNERNRIIAWFKESGMDSLLIGQLNKMIESTIIQMRKDFYDAKKVFEQENAELIKEVASGLMIERNEEGECNGEHNTKEE